MVGFSEDHVRVGEEAVESVLAAGASAAKFAKAHGKLGAVAVTVLAAGLAFGTGYVDLTSFSLATSDVASKTGDVVTDMFNGLSSNLDSAVNTSGQVLQSIRAFPYAEAASSAFWSPCMKKIPSVVAGLLITATGLVGSGVLIVQSFASREKPAPSDRNAQKCYLHIPGKEKKGKSTEEYKEYTKKLRELFRTSPDNFTKYHKDGCTYYRLKDCAKTVKAS